MRHGDYSLMDKEKKKKKKTNEQKFQLVLSLIEEMKQDDERVWAREEGLSMRGYEGLRRHMTCNVTVPGITQRISSPLASASAHI